MKKRIIIGLGIFSLFFLLGGIYIIGTIEKATSTLDNLIKLHQVEILREQLLSDAKRVQSDLAFRGTHYATELETMISNVIRMGNEAKKCSECHHTEEIARKIAELREQIQSYEGSVSRVLTIRAAAARMKGEEHGAFRVGQELVNQLNRMTSLTRERLAKNTEFSLKRIRQMKILLFLLISAGPILAIGLAIVFIKGLTEPLHVLLQATRKVKAGDLSFRIQGLRDEFGEVAASFNEMASSLHEQMQNCQRAEQMKVVGEMAAGLVHEIKNPLTGIKATIQVLLQEGSYPEDDRVILSKVMEEVKRIETLMKSLLDFAKPPKPHLVPIDVNTVLDSTISFSLPYSSLASGRNGAIEVVKDFDRDLPPTMADPAQMQQVFLNLFMNALEAMAGGGTLSVRTREDEAGHAVRIEVADTGKGIDEETRGRLFHPFFTTKHKGTGLGLAVSKRFVEMNGGTISVDDNPGGGTVFSIVLPPAD